MSFDVALRLTAFFVGAFLHGVFVFGVLGRAPRRRSERVLRLFFAALFLWFAGSLLGLALSEARGPTAALLRTGFALAAFAGLGCQPPLLLHAVAAEGRERRRLARLPAGERALILLAYLPLGGLPFALWRIAQPPAVPPLERLAFLVQPWAVYYTLVILATALLSVHIGRVTSPSDRRLDRALAVALLVPAFGLTYAYVLDGRHGPHGYTLETLAMASSLLPTLVFTYYVYRYRVLGYVVRDGAVALLASGSFVAFYLFFVREGARRAGEAAGLPPLVLEAAVLTVLVLLFRPWGDTLGGLARRYLAGGRERLRRQAALCASRLGRASGVAEVRAALQETLEGPDLARVQLLAGEGVPVGSADVLRLGEACPALSAAMAGGLATVVRASVPSAAVLGELDRTGADGALALRSRDRLHGALLLASRERRGLYREDLDDLAAVAQGAAQALEAARLLAEKGDAERQAAQAERMASLGWLAASVAHEVKNPLSSIKAVAQVLAGEADGEGRTRADLELIVREADRLDRAVDRLLSVGRPGGGEPPVDLAQELDRLAIALGPGARARGVRLEFRVAGETRVRASAAALWDVFYNLAQNAIEAMPRGGAFRVASEPEARPGWLRLRVEDDGPGIPPEVGERIFEAYFTTRPQGHGLGLALVRRRLHEVGGSIRLLPGPGGAVFEIELPAA